MSNHGLGAATDEVAASSENTSWSVSRRSGQKGIDVDPPGSPDDAPNLRRRADRDVERAVYGWFVAAADSDDTANNVGPVHGIHAKRPHP